MIFLSLIQNPLLHLRNIIKYRRKRHIRYIANDLNTTTGFLQNVDSKYVRHVSLISGVWNKAKDNAALAVNTELLDASRATGVLLG